MTKDYRSKWELQGVIRNLERKSMSEYGEEKFYEVYGIKKINEVDVYIDVCKFLTRVKEVLGEEFTKFEANSNTELCTKIIDKYRESLNIFVNDNDSNEELLSIIVL